MNEIVLHGQDPEQTYTVTVTNARTFVIGRSSNCDLVLSDRNVSRQHASISWRADVFSLCNLSQTNSIYLKDRQTLTYKQQVELTPGFMFRIGSSWFTVQAEAVIEHRVECSGCGRSADIAWQTCKYCGTSLAGAQTIIEWENLD
ncbi:MAG TPA: FHA domain-containing protein [Anaerolineae bacterium]|jgi:predicted component of type VI protein secretion system